MYFPTYRVPKTSLDTGLKAHVLEQPLIVNTLKGPKHYGYLHNNTFIIFVHHSQGNWVEQFLS